MADMPSPSDDSNWFRALWGAVSLLAGYFIYDLRAKLSSKVGSKEFDALKDAFKRELSSVGEAFRGALRADREACEASRSRFEVLLADHESRLRGMETYRAEVAALGTNVGNLAEKVQSLADLSDEHHKQNRIEAGKDRESTEAWRNTFMAPILKQLSDAAVTNSEAVKLLKERDEDKEQRLRDLEQRRTTRTRRRGDKR